MTVNVAAIRAKTGLSQRAFSSLYGLPLATLQNWEQARCGLDAAHQTLFRLIDRDHRAVAAMLSHAS
jgi:putative transcriptional regulator